MPCLGAAKGEEENECSWRGKVSVREAFSFEEPKVNLGVDANCGRENEFGSGVNACCLGSEGGLEVG